MNTEKPPWRRETTHSVRLHLECCCGQSVTLWVNPDAPVQTVAKAHGWRFVVTGWVCPKCLEDAHE